MFGRKNQDVLTQHYDKLVDRDAGDDDDDFMTLKRVDHELPDEDAVPLVHIKEDNLSHRKAKLGNAKKTILLHASTSKKLVFNDDGEARVANAVADADEWVKEKGGMEGVMQEVAKYAEDGRSKLKVADVVDKEEAKEKKREKKRKRKEREKGLVGSFHTVMFYSLIFV